jgi:hypothetical protein
MDGPMAERAEGVKAGAAAFPAVQFPLCAIQFTTGAKAERSPPESLTRRFSCFVLWQTCEQRILQDGKFAQIFTFVLRIGCLVLTGFEAPAPASPAAVKLRGRALNKACPNHGRPAIHALSGGGNTSPRLIADKAHKAVPAVRGQTRKGVKTAVPKQDTDKMPSHANGISRRRVASTSGGRGRRQGLRWT